jgi:hypothetical protein
MYLGIHCNLHATDPLNIVDGDLGWKFLDESLPSVINMLAEIRQLRISSNVNAIEWDRLSERIKTALWNTRFTSPHLSFLSLNEISISPHDLVDTWKSIKEIVLQSVKLNTSEGTSRNVSILEHRLERVEISGREFSLPLALQNSQILGGLRRFEVLLFRVCPYAIRQTWDVIHIASKSLETLVLMECFGA